MKYLILLVPVIGAALFIGGLFYRRYLKARLVGLVRTEGTVILITR